MRVLYAMRRDVVDRLLGYQHKLWPWFIIWLDVPAPHPMTSSRWLLYSLNDVLALLVMIDLLWFEKKSTIFPTFPNLQRTIFRADDTLIIWLTDGFLFKKSVSPASFQIACEWIIWLIDGFLLEIDCESRLILNRVLMNYLADRLFYVILNCREWII